MRQPDSAVKIQVYKIDNEKTRTPVFMVGFEDSNRLERFRISPGMTMQSVASAAQKHFRVPTSETLVLYSDFSDDAISNERDAKQVFEELSKKTDVVNIYIRVSGNKPKRRNPPASTPVRTYESPLQQTPVQTQLSTSKSPRRLDFDSMLATLDRNISQKREAENIPLSVRLGEYQRDLEKMVARQMKRTSSRRNSSRLSRKYNENNSGTDVDAQAVFNTLKMTKNSLSGLEAVHYELTVESQFIDWRNLD
jgi:hypothetical protein